MTKKIEKTLYSIVILSLLMWGTGLINIVEAKPGKGNQGQNQANNQGEDQSNKEHYRKRNGGQEKITICHFPPGNPANVHAITIAMPAWAAHQRHSASGDYNDFICDENYPNKKCGDEGDYPGISYCDDCTWSDCVATEYCGDNKINGFEGVEECDGNDPQNCTTNEGYDGTSSCDACIWSNCESEEYCGDGTTNGNEQCDDGLNGSVTCTNECTLIYMDFVNIGIVSSETDHNLDGWTDLWTWGGGYGGGDDGSLRLLMGPGDGCSEIYESASLTLDAGTNYANEVTFRHLDGSADDSFDVYINNTLIGHYTAGLQGEIWVTSTFNFSSTTGEFTIKFVATEPSNNWCTGWGQVAFSWIGI